MKSATAPPATAPSCGQQPLHRPGGPSRSSSIAPPKPKFATPDSSATIRQGIKSTIPPAGNAGEQARWRDCGFALANKGHDTRALQAYLGHKNIQHTVRYTELSPTRFKDFWR
jgi:Phage integrase family